MAQLTSIPVPSTSRKRSLPSTRADQDASERKKPRTSLRTGLLSRTFKENTKDTPRRQPTSHSDASYSTPRRSLHQQPLKYGPQGTPIPESARKPTTVLKGPVPEPDSDAEDPYLLHGASFRINSSARKSRSRGTPGSTARKAHLRINYTPRSASIANVSASRADNSGMLDPEEDTFAFTKAGHIKLGSVLQHEPGLFDGDADLLSPTSDNSDAHEQFFNGSFYSSTSTGSPVRSNDTPQTAQVLIQEATSPPSAHSRSSPYPDLHQSSSRVLDDMLDANVSDIQQQEEQMNDTWNVGDTTASWDMDAPEPDLSIDDDDTIKLPAAQWNDQSQAFKLDPQLQEEPIEESNSSISLPAREPAFEQSNEEPALKEPPQEILSNPAPSLDSPAPPVPVEPARSPAPHSPDMSENVPSFVASTSKHDEQDELPREDPIMDQAPSQSATLSVASLRQRIRELTRPLNIVRSHSPAVSTAPSATDEPLVAPLEHYINSPGRREGHADVGDLDVTTHTVQEVRFASRSRENSPARESFREQGLSSPVKLGSAFRPPGTPYRGLGNHSESRLSNESLSPSPPSSPPLESIPRIEFSPAAQPVVSTSKAQDAVQYADVSHTHTQSPPSIEHGGETSRVASLHNMLRGLSSSPAAHLMSSPPNGAPEAAASISAVQSPRDEFPDSPRRNFTHQSPRSAELSPARPGLFSEAKFESPYRPNRSSPLKLGSPLKYQADDPLQGPDPDSPASRASQRLSARSQASVDAHRSTPRSTGLMSFASISAAADGDESEEDFVSPGSNASPVKRGDIPKSTKKLMEELTSSPSAGLMSSPYLDLQQASSRVFGNTSIGVEGKLQQTDQDRLSVRSGRQLLESWAAENNEAALENVQGVPSPNSHDRSRAEDALKAIPQGRVQIRTEGYENQADDLTEERDELGETISGLGDTTLMPFPAGNTAVAASAHLSRRPKTSLHRRTLSGSTIEIRSADPEIAARVAAILTTQHDYHVNNEDSEWEQQEKQRRRAQRLEELLSRAQVEITSQVDEQSHRDPSPQHSPVARVGTARLEVPTKRHIHRHDAWTKSDWRHLEACLKQLQKSYYDAGVLEPRPDPEEVLQQFLQQLALTERALHGHWSKQKVLYRIEALLEHRCHPETKAFLSPPRHERSASTSLSSRASSVGLEAYEAHEKRKDAQSAQGLLARMGSMIGM